MRASKAISLLLAWLVCAPAAAQVDLDTYLKRDTYERVKISPTGEFLASSNTWMRATNISTSTSFPWTGKASARFTQGTPPELRLASHQATMFESPTWKR